MVDGINFDGKVTGMNDIKEKAGVSDKATPASTFGEGFSSNTGVEFKRTIPGLDSRLLSKFDFETPKYDKNIRQLEINDKYYISDKSFKEEQLCEV